MRFPLAPLAVAALVAAVASPPSSAMTATRNIVQVGSGLCAANNPTNNTSLRRLPQGLRNVGSVNVSVVCSLWGDDATAAAASAVAVYLRNEKTDGTHVTCTLTMGTPFYTQSASTKTTDLPGADGSQLEWSTADYGTDGDKQWVNLQCSLPPGIVIEEIHMAYAEDIGS
jgi:hypothetical protein